MDFLINYGLFLSKTLTVLISVLVVIVVMVGMGQRQRKGDKGHIEVTNLNKELEEVTSSLKQIVLEPGDLKREIKDKKKDEKREKKEKQKQKKLQKKQNSETQSIEPEGADVEVQEKSRVFVLDFVGDIRASQVTAFREEITAILSLATTADEVLVRLESPGGLVHSYGLAASQLKRIVDKKIRLTVTVDKVAASGGYMMACIADHLVAAPFALLGSIGVVAQIPNFHRLLKEKNVDVEILTAGEYKRTLTMFGENTDKAREKFLGDMEDVHTLFKEFVTENRPSVNIEEVATGEAWYGTRALEHKLVDDLITSDEQISELCQHARVFHVKYVLHKNKMDKVMEKFSSLYQKGIFGSQNDIQNKPYYF